LAGPTGPAYAEYAQAHVHELVTRYRPSILWNDIGWPEAGHLATVFADYYNTVEDGVINDRWKEPDLARHQVTDALVRGAGAAVQALWQFIPEQRKHLTFATPKHYDFRTPEYEVLRTVTARKWELAQGVGHSFGANRHERPEDIISETDLIQRFCDVVSKNGNLLIGIGPRPDGTIPDLQQAPLRGLGAWLDVNAEAIYGSRPWVVAESITVDGTPLRFTKSGEGVYALIMGMPRARRIIMRAIDGARVRRVRLVGADAPLDFAVARDGDLSVTLPERLPMAAVTVLDLGTDVRARVGRSE
jgi:alpha-L-fucosidase